MRVGHNILVCLVSLVFPVSRRENGLRLGRLKANPIGVAPADGPSGSALQLGPDFCHRSAVCDPGDVVNEGQAADCPASLSGLVYPAHVE